MSFLRHLRNKIKIFFHALKNPGHISSVTYRKYPKDSVFTGMRVLNVGCGTTTYPSPNVVNVDLFPNPGVNLVQDLSKTPYPLEANSFDLVIANHILEHVPNWWECFKECARLVKPGGRVEVWLPGDGTSSQLGYRDHINVINYCSFHGTIGANRNQANAWELEEAKKVGDVRSLELVERYTTLYSAWWVHMWPDCVINWMVEHLRNVATEQGFIFVKRPGRGQ